MKRLLPLLVAACMLLSACAQGKPVETTDEATTTQNQTEQSTAAQKETETQATQDTTVPEQKVNLVQYRNPLNGSPMEKPMTNRPFAVVINNIVYAMPACSVGEADMVYELLAEGGITRCVAVYDDISGMKHMGAIRSARPYLVEVAESMGAIFVHHGGSADGYNEARSTAHLDAMTNAGNAYYRDQARLDNGYALEHTSFADGDSLIEAASNLGFDLAYDEPVDFGLNFADMGSTADGEKAEEISIVFGGFGKTTTLTYDQSTGKYNAHQYDMEYIDGNTGKGVSYRNVIYITTEVSSYIDINNIERMSIATLGQGDGYFACDGKIVPIRWSHSATEEPFQYTRMDGTPITLGVGNTYVAIAPLSGEINY